MGAEAWQAWAVALAFTPLIYYLNRPYMNATPLLACLFLGIWAFARYMKSSSRTDLVLASVAAAFVLFFRYEYCLFIGPLMLWALYIKHQTLNSRAYILDVAIFGIAIVVLFAIPIAALNQWIYGDWKTYGPGLFNDVYFPSRTGSEETSIFSSAFKSARSLLLPSYPLDLGQTLRNVPRLTVLLAPAYTAIALIGMLFIVRTQSCGRGNLSLCSCSPSTSSCTAGPGAHGQLTKRNQHSRLPSSGTGYHCMS